MKTVKSNDDIQVAIKEKSRISFIVGLILVGLAALSLFLFWKISFLVSIILSVVLGFAAYFAFQTASDPIVKAFTRTNFRKILWQKLGPEELQYLYVYDEGEYKYPGQNPTGEIITKEFFTGLHVRITDHSHPVSSEEYYHHVGMTIEGCSDEFDVTDSIEDLSKADFSDEVNAYYSNKEYIANQIRAKLKQLSDECEQKQKNNRLSYEQKKQSEKSKEEWLDSHF